MAEKIVRLNDEQWGVLKVALDGEIADLQRQLQQAQEERGRLEGVAVQFNARISDLTGERDAAIERAEAVEALVEVQQENEAELVNACIWNLEQCPGDHCNDVTRVHDRLLKRREELAGEEGCKCGGVLRHPCGPKCLALRQALRAEHRSPQSGQEEGD